MQTNEFDEEFEDDYDEDVHTPDQDDMFIEDSGPLGSRYSLSCEGKFLGEFNDWDELAEAGREWMEQNQWWPSVWYVDDHGGMTIADISIPIEEKVTKKLTS